MEALHNRGVALILCVAMVALACVAGTGVSLRQLREQSELTFTLGAAGDGRGIQYDLGELAAQCYNITVIASRYLPATDANIAGVLEKREALLAADSPKEKHRANQEMLAAANVLRHTLDVLDLDTQDKTLLEQCAVNISTTQSLIENSGYNAAATYYNRSLGSFPANLFGSLTGVKPLELYE